MLDFILQVYRGRTLGRILLNRAVRKHAKEILGSVIDIAGGRSASYYQYLPQGLNVIATNKKESTGIDKEIDFNKPLPFEKNSFDSILFLNALYIPENPQALLAECNRILKPGGRLFIGSPFIANEMPEPHDYMRFTAEGIKRELNNAGFEKVFIERVGERVSAAVQLLHPLFIFNTVRLFAYSVALLIDKAVPKRVRVLHPTPILYFCVATK